MLTTFDDDGYVTGALAAEELVHAVRVVASGEALLSPAVTTRLIERVLPALTAESQRVAARSGDLALLTDREAEVLLLVARGSSNVEIAAMLTISEATVKTHVSHVLSKLGLRDRFQAVVAAYELGLLTPATSDATASRGQPRRQ